MSDKDIVREQARKILESGVLGRSRFYAALLEYLVACGERDHAPKEIEIAAEVFSRGDEFDPSQDSMVRVYAHNLRQKLQQFYAEQGRDEPHQITVPKGEYRIAVLTAGAAEAPVAPVPVATAAPAAAVVAPARHRMPLALAAVLIAGLAAGVFLDRLWSRNLDPAAEAYRELAASPLWSAIADDELPVTMVVGDYFIFGERDRYGNVTRMVREFDINSSRDLDEHFMLDPDSADWVRAYLRDYQQATGATILMASHNMAEVERLCGDVLMMKNGRIVDRGTPAALIARYGRLNLEEVFLVIARNGALGGAEP